MKVLFIVGTCLSKNTSANMSHNSYIRGLVENGCEVDVIMKNDSWGQTDSILKKIDGVNYIEYEANSFIDKIRLKIRDKVTQTATTDQHSSNITPKSIKKSISLRSIIKNLFYKIFPQDKIYPIDHVWISNALQFRSPTVYDLVISNSSPAASHKLAQMLIDNRNIQTSRWVQIWEDPWYHDLYGNHSDAIKEEERHLLESATEILYVSPLTTEYQKKYFPTAAHKMKTIALPYLEIEDTPCGGASDAQFSYGYFGDYYSYTRNLVPFFNALNNSKRNGYICGDSDLSLHSDNIKISARVTLDVLKDIQQKTSVLVHLSNLQGGQIPGKIYHYSATTKPILFILDGTNEEQNILRTYFGKLNRYYFCENTEESILNAFGQIESNYLVGGKEEPVLQYSPKEVIKTLIYC